MPKMSQRLTAVGRYFLTQRKEGQIPGDSGADRVQRESAKARVLAGRAG